MAENTGNLSGNPVGLYLQDAAAAEKAFEIQLREFAGFDGDDDEVQSLFAVHADETRAPRERLAARLHEIGEDLAPAKASLASILDLVPHIAQAGHASEERTVQNLIIAYTVEAGECAMYESLAGVARAAGDRATEALARDIQSQERRAADKIFHLLPSRSKIAFNMLTLTEVDPSVETKIADDRLIET